MIMKLSFYLQDNKFPCYEYKATAHSQGPDYVVLGEHDRALYEWHSPESELSQCSLEGHPPRI